MTWINFIIPSRLKMLFLDFFSVFLRFIVYNFFNIFIVIFLIFLLFSLPEDSLFFLFGDHGMTDEGNHGSSNYKKKWDVLSFNISLYLKKKQDVLLFINLFFWYRCIFLLNLENKEIRIKPLKVIKYLKILINLSLLRFLYAYSQCHY